MAFIIPWIFRAGTKAKSAEVNENFLAVKQFVDLLEEDVAANQIAVETLEDTKANLNGNPTERFQVATAIVGNDAVNLNTLEKNSQNARGYIDGYRLNYAGKRVTATKGTCYSYNPNTETYEFLIKSDTTLQTEALTLGANATYYVFVCGDSVGAEYPALSVGTNNTTPSLPVGLDCWRRLGSFTTDDDGNIEEILNEGQQSLLGFTGFITSFLGSITVNKDNEDGQEYTAEQNMYLYHHADTADFSGNIKVELKIQETWREIAFIGIGSDFDQDLSSFLVPIKKGQEYRLTATKINKIINKYGMGR